MKSKRKTVKSRKDVYILLYVWVFGFRLRFDKEKREKSGGTAWKWMRMKSINREAMIKCTRQQQRLYPRGFRALAETLFVELHSTLPHLGFGNFVTFMPPHWHKVKLRGL